MLLAFRTRMTLLQTMTRMLAHRLVRQDGLAEWVSSLMLIGIVILVAAGVFAFWKGGGLTWVNTRLEDITNY